MEGAATLHSSAAFVAARARGATAAADAYVYRSEFRLLLLLLCCVATWCALPPVGECPAAAFTTPSAPHTTSYLAARWVAPPIPSSAPTLCMHS